MQSTYQQVARPQGHAIQASHHVSLIKPTQELVAQVGGCGHEDAPADAVAGDGRQLLLRLLVQRQRSQQLRGALLLLQRPDVLQLRPPLLSLRIKIVPALPNVSTYAITGKDCPAPLTLLSHQQHCICLRILARTSAVFVMPFLSPYGQQLASCLQGAAPSQMQ